MRKHIICLGDSNTHGYCADPNDCADHGNRFNPDPKRPRRLLMHKREIMRLFGKVKQDGYSLIPLSVYFKGSRVKVNVGLCKGKKLYDKRQSAAERDAKRQIDRAMKERY